MSPLRVVVVTSHAVVEPRRGRAAQRATMDIAWRGTTALALWSRPLRSPRRRFPQAVLTENRALAGTTRCASARTLVAGSVFFQRSRLLFVDQLGHAAQAEQVALGTEACDHAVSARGDEGVVPKLLTLVHVRDVHLDHRRLEGVECVQDRHRGVGEGGRVHHDAAGDLARFVNPVNQFVFPVGLVKADVEVQFLGQFPAISLNICQRLMAIDVRLALAKQVEVRPVEDEYEAAHWTYSGSMMGEDFAKELLGTRMVGRLEEGLGRCL